MLRVPRPTEPPKDESVIKGTPPPDALAICMALIAAYALHNGNRLPAIMPRAPRDAAAWWLAHQEPRHRMEKQRQVPVHGSSAHRWDDSYALRVTQNLRIFLFLPDDDKAFIVSAVRAGIPWRGDRVDFFEKIIEEHEKMLEVGIDEYHEQAGRYAQRVIGKAVA